MTRLREAAGLALVIAGLLALLAPVIPGTALLLFAGSSRSRTQSPASPSLDETVRALSQFTTEEESVRCPALEQNLDHQAVDKRNALLMISAFEEDHIGLGHIFGESNWTLHGVCTYREATVLMRENPPPVVICESDLPDGNWKDILRESILLAHPPSLIVTSRLADECLWMEVLDLGGYDVLAKPLGEKEVRWVVDSAWLHWGQRAQAKRVQKAVA